MTVHQIARPHRHIGKLFTRPWRWLRLFTLAVALAPAPGCQRKKIIESPPPPPPVAKFTGPSFLYGSIGSLTAVRGAGPLLVSGWGLVVGLHGTGSADMPQPIRRRMIQIVRRHRLGDAFLDSDQTAVVRVSGLIPPGAVPGSRFDLLIEALPNSQTTSLRHGRLWSTELAINGANPRMLYSSPLAKGRGPIYADPFQSGADPNEGQPTVLQTQAVVLAGGVVTQARRLDLLLNEPSWAMSARIADRINQRFRKGPTDRRETAVAMDDRLIEMNIPRRFAADPDQLVSLIQHLYLQQQGDFVKVQARRLLTVLREQPRYAQRVSLAWQALGKQVWQVIRPLYDDADLPVRLTALEAGARLGDLRTVPHLIDLASKSDPKLRQGAARLLAELPGTPDADRTLYKLLDDDDIQVRIAAYEALARSAAPVLDRTVFREENNEIKFVLDLVPAKHPLIYITQASVPRIAIFHRRLAFQRPLLAKAWGGELRLRAEGSDGKMLAYYKPFTTDTAKTVELHPFVPNFVFLLAQRPTIENPAQGFNLSFSEVADILNQLQKSGAIDSPLHVEPNRLAQAVEKARNTPAPGPRPEADNEFNQAERFLKRPEAQPGDTSKSVRPQ